MRDFENLFAAFRRDAASSRAEGLVLLSAEAPLRIYYGLSARRNPRLAFLSDAKPPEIASTKAIRVSCVQEAEEYWMFFDLLEQTASAVYFTLCDDLVGALESSSAKDSASAVMCLKNRFTAWRKMFRQERGTLSEEQVVGLLGELYFMERFLMPEIGAARAVRAWSGTDGTSKDFSDGDRWYEVKAASLGANAVKISSLAQLSSDVPGALAVVRYETMSQGYDDPNCTVFRVFKRIMAAIEDDAVRADFLSKLVTYGFDVMQETEGSRYRIADMAFYRVDGDFPRIQEKDIRHRTIDKVAYCLLLNGIDGYRFDGRL
ncbi:MAG: PD-(D/E)XK motif protein [Kiritimatiellia bacterium]